MGYLGTAFSCWLYDVVSKLVGGTTISLGESL